MRVIIGIILVVVGLIVFVLGNKQVGKQGKIEKVFFPSKRMKFVTWAISGVLIYLGVIIIFNKLSWLGL
jgi:cadmium resistance protein CadD (predicted permease)